MAHPSNPPAEGWDLFCQVVDNFGDVGVCWRLARGLAERGLAVRLYIDDASALGWMAGAAANAAANAEPDAGANARAAVHVLPWPRAGEASLTPGTVVIEAFGCNPPPAFVAAMAACSPAPVWLNLEHLSAEPFVERSHGLASPQPCGLTKWFFFPGFTPRTGGLLREDGLLQARASFERDPWLAAQGLQRRPGERVVSLFCYDNAALPAVLQRLGEQPTLLLLTPGHAQRLVSTDVPGLRCVRLPWLAQDAYDRLLWACDLNFVRGEDSLVRAIWAGAPFVWQVYPQDDGAHTPKLEALLAQLQGPADVAALWRAWNEGPLAGPLRIPAWPAAEPWHSACQAWRSRLAAQDDLLNQLQHFVSGKIGGAAARRC